MDENLIMGILWGVYLLILLPLYIIREKQTGPVKAVGYKLVLSGIFCILGIFAAVRQNASAFSILILPGLVCSMIGDYYLAFIKVDENKFRKGILCFGAAQGFYIAAMAAVEGFGFLEFVITSAVLAPIILGKRKLKLNTGKADLPLTGYLILIIFMVVKATLMLASGHSPIALQELFTAGALLFIVSDVFLGIDSFMISRQTFKYLVAICYFAGQLMIATSSFSTFIA